MSFEFAVCVSVSASADLAVLQRCIHFIANIEESRHLIAAKAVERTRSRSTLALRIYIYTCHICRVQVLCVQLLEISGIFWVEEKDICIARTLRSLCDLLMIDSHSTVIAMSMLLI